jgi:hypothetical protein
MPQLTEYVIAFISEQERPSVFCRSVRVLLNAKLPGSRFQRAEEWMKCPPHSPGLTPCNFSVGICIGNIICVICTAWYVLLRSTENTVTIDKSLFERLGWAGLETGCLWSQFLLETCGVIDLPRDKIWSPEAIRGFSLNSSNHAAHENFCHETSEILVTFGRELSK